MDLLKDEHHASWGCYRGELVKLLEEDRGGAAIEMAVVLPVFFILLFGLFSFAIILFGYGNATYASRAGSRFASLHSATSLSPCTASSVQSFVMPFLWAAPSGGVTVATTWSPSNTVGSTVNVVDQHCLSDWRVGFERGARYHIERGATDRCALMWTL